MTRKKRKRADGLTCQERITSEVHIKALLGRTCKGCKRACLNTFLSGQAFRDLLEFRQRWVDIHKVDQDRIVFDKMKALKAASTESTVAWTFNGNGRFQRLWGAASRGADGPPADLRFVTKPKSQTIGNCSTARVVSFLQTLYDSVAETLPDVRDDGIELSIFGGGESVDPYATVDLPPALMEPVKRQKVRRYKQGLKVHVEREPETSGVEERYLPPGTMKEYYEQFKCLDDSVSFSTFWRVWRTEFNYLKFRGVTSHAQCSCCIHHRLLLKELAPYIHAHAKQASLFHLHLAAQYRDRMIYWSFRGSSRLRVMGHLTIIQDGMDQAKFALPRTRLVLAKDLATLQRPKLGVIGVIAHGWSFLMAISNPDQPKDSSCMADLFCHMLTRLERLGIIFGASMKHLRSGHSHEDIDQTFGGCSLFIIRHGKLLETPDDFCKVIQSYVNTAPRPFEEQRAVVKLDQHRPWKEFLSLAVPVTTQGMGGPGAPHQFDVSRREDLGSSAPLMLMSFTFHSVHVVSDLC
ncbi:unnamed protein product [Durusdinium trenchii]|uniref:Uncharacterized protein n=2 Tax=Durusdinium trenchii TaxID=1381693 RepID=A0ABP0M375_9DINO